MNDIAKLTDHAAQQDDRWLFVFLLIFLLCSFGIFFRWLLKDRDAITRRLTEITDKHIDQSSKLAEVVSNNTNAARENTETMKEFSKIIGRCNHSNL
jgi:hypothetical protein